MTRHTPGPWEYRPASNYVGFSIAPLGTLPTLAAVERPRGNPDTINVTAHNFPGETEHNARLIAASPDLLEACKMMLHALSLSLETERIARDMLEEIAFHAMASAVDKAEGE